MFKNHCFKMKPSVRFLIKCMAVAGLATVLGTVSAATNYTVANLSLGGSYSFSNSVNSSGTATGSSYPTGGVDYHAFIYNKSLGLQDLHTLGGTYSAGNAINDNGQVTGVSRTGDGAYHAFIYNGSGAIQDLDNLGSNSSGNAINNNGQVTGSVYLTGNASTHAFRYNGSFPLQDLGTLGVESSGRAINASGQVTGVFSTGKDYTDLNFNGYPIQRAFFYNGIGMQDIGTLGGDFSYGAAINVSGQITGGASTTLGSGQVTAGGNPSTLGSINYHAFIYTGGVMHDLGTFGGLRSKGVAINSIGQVTGSADTATGSHAFIYNGTASPIQNLGTLGGTNSSGTAINTSGQITGTSDNTGNTSQSAFLWSAAEGMIDLNTRLSNVPAGLHLYSADGISDTGFIVAQSNVGAVLLSPVREIQFAKFLPSLALDYGVGSTTGSFAFGAQVAIGTGGNAFDPLKDVVTLSLDKVVTTLAPGSFKNVPFAGYVYSGTVGTTKIVATILPMGTAGAYAVGIAANAINLNTVSNPVNVSLLIGINIGTQSVIPIIKRSATINPFE